MRLIDHLSETDHAVNWWLPRGSKSALQVASLVALRRGQHLNMFDRAVAIRTDSAFDAACWLVALDGFAKSVLIVPTAIDDAIAGEFIADANCDWLVGKETLKLRELSSFALGTGVIDTKWLVMTSGTTGHPKVVDHTLASLTRTTRSIKEMGRDLCWGLLYDIGRFAGLQVFLQAVLGGSSLCFTPRESSLSSQLSFLELSGCNALSATPTLWRRILMINSHKQMKLRAVTLGGEIADRSVLAAVGRAWPSARVRHIYASTEAGVGFSVTDGRPGFPVSFLANPPADVELRVDETGILWVRPSSQGEPLIPLGTAGLGPEGWLNTGDAVTQQGDRLIFRGRGNGAINVGGNKVFPQEIEEIVQEISGVGAALAVGRPNSMTGQVVELFVEVTDRTLAGQLPTIIHARCRDVLPRWKVPASIHVVDALPVSAAGKLLRPSTPVCDPTE